MFFCIDFIGRNTLDDNYELFAPALLLLVKSDSGVSFSFSIFGQAVYSLMISGG